MNLSKLEKTPWAKELKAETPDYYEEGLDLALNPKLVVGLYKTDETGEKLWAIIAENSNSFWMDAKKTKKEALALCKEMGWKVR